MRRTGIKQTAQDMLRRRREAAKKKATVTGRNGMYVGTGKNKKLNVTKEQLKNSGGSLRQYANYMEKNDGKRPSKGFFESKPKPIPSVKKKSPNFIDMATKKKVDVKLPPKKDTTKKSTTTTNKKVKRKPGESIGAYNRRKRIEEARKNRAKPQRPSELSGVTRRKAREARKNRAPKPQRPRELSGVTKRKARENRRNR